MDQRLDPRSNHLLSALTDAEWQRWQQQLEFIDLTLGQVLYESGPTQSHVYFPVTAIVSLLHLTAKGASAEIAVIGNEGAVGIPLFVGGRLATGRGVVLGAGQGLRIGSQLIQEELDRAGPAANLLLRYSQALMTQIAQTVVCNRHHTLDQQFCRLLLVSLDRQPGGELLMTHERIAHMLGVRREGVTAAALRLQAAGLIHYTRGYISVPDRRGAGAPHLRVLCRGQGGVSPPAARGGEGADWQQWPAVVAGTDPPGPGRMTRRRTPRVDCADPRSQWSR
jgi:CRP-like cAMP-binding protein